ncbi:MAG: coproporphyrinogen oxidase [Candidatus Hydrogenedentota bacterium]
MLGGVDIERAFRRVHDRISAFLAEQDGRPYREDVWDYDRGSGGGVTRVWEHATLIEKGGVNFSAIRGVSLPKAAATQFQIPENTPFFATGVSLVIHPWNPHVPTVHMNVRYFEAGTLWWFGGGMDLTPYYPVREQVVAFHRALKSLCAECGEDYAFHKKTCDEYFYIRHRNEMRGVGGIFFDHLYADKEKHLRFTEQLGMAFNDIYRPLVEANRDRAYTAEQRDFQLYRRSRYVEFNLIYDRGTLFGLQSGGRIESILMSLPATANWRYNWSPQPGTPEAELTEVYLTPRDWAGE